MTDPRTEAAARAIAAYYDAQANEHHDRYTESDLGAARAALAAADKAATITEAKELDALPVGTVVYAANHIGPAERFKEGWMGCGSTAAWSSAILARDGLPARVINFGGTE